MQSISIDSPDPISLTSGAYWWIGYFIIVSVVFALLLKLVFKVRI